MPMEGVRGQNRKNLPTSLMDGPYIYFLDGGLGERISTNHHSVVKKNSITNWEKTSPKLLQLKNYPQKLKSPLSDQNFISKMWQMWKWKFYVVRSERGDFDFVDIITYGLSFHAMEIFDLLFLSWVKNATVPSLETYKKCNILQLVSLFQSSHTLLKHQVYL